MKYTLITRSGKVLTFTVKACAQQFQAAYGGVLFTDHIVEQPETVDQ